VRATDEDVVEFEQARWHPAGAEEPFALDVKALFGEAFSAR
jgi:hypothetical protein